MFYTFYILYKKAIKIYQKKKKKIYIYIYICIEINLVSSYGIIFKKHYDELLLTIFSTHLPFLHSSVNSENSILSCKIFANPCFEITNFFACLLK